jgi:hypothetical protein
MTIHNCKALAIPTLLNGRKVWIMRKTDEMSHISQSAEMDSRLNPF